MIRLFEAFAGIGSQAEALKELGIDFVPVGISDIDKHAITGYEAIHGPVKNYGDITKIEHLPECDLLTYSYPCTSVSVAGKQEGMKEGSGTASALLWEVGRLLKDMDERNCLPEVLLMENVDAVLNQKNIGEFKRWLSLLSDMGYTSSYQIMNAKDYGTPQNRRRIFCVSTLTMGEFVFPEPCPDGRVLRDVLEKNVPEKYFLSDERLATFKRHKERNEAKGNHFGFQVLDLEKDHVSKTVTTVGDRYCNTYIGVPEGVEEAEEPNMPKVAVDGIERVGQLNIEGWGRQGSEVVGTDGVSPCVTSQSNNTRLKIEIVGELNQPGWHEILQRVYGKDGLGPTLTNGRSPMLEDKE